MVLSSKVDSPSSEGRVYVPGGALQWPQLMERGGSDATQLLSLGPKSLNQALS